MDMLNRTKEMMQGGCTTLGGESEKYWQQDNSHYNTQMLIGNQTPDEMMGYDHSQNRFDRDEEGKDGSYHSH